MIKKNILLADADAQALVEFRQAMGDEWEVTAVTSGTAALTEMEKNPSDVLIADLDLAELDGGELLNRVQSRYPKTVRFILAREADRERVVKQVLGAHQFIGKPLDGATLKAAIERAVALESWIPKNSIRELVARIRTLPTIPSLYLEVLALLRQPDTTTEQVGAIIAKDMAMMTKLLQVLNSACFGLSRKITNPTEAVGILGFETVGSMVMTIKLLSQYDKVKPVYFSIDRLWRHSTDVARTAKQITRWHTDDHALSEAAFTGGLMHDLGKVILAANFDEQYRGAQSLARKQQLPLWEVEKEIFGATHGEIGAYLLGTWGMPLDLLEVAAFHHHPARGANKNFTPLTAVHIANALEHEVNPDKEGALASKIDEAYLAEIGVLGELETWRAAVAKRDFAKPEVKTSSSKSAPAAVRTPKAATPAAAPPLRTPNSSIPTPAIGLLQRPWFYGALGAAIVLLVLAWIGVEMTIDHFQNSKLATEQPPAPKLMASAEPPAREVPSPVSKLVEPVAALVKPAAPAITAPIAASLAPVNPKPPVATAPSPANVAPAESGFPEMKLQGIFLSSDHPSAIINGKLLQANEKFKGVQIVEITRSSVILEYQNHRKTLVMQ